MYEDPDDADDTGEAPKPKRSADPATAAREQVDQLRLHAELAAVFEGTRKFDAHVRPNLDPDLARDVQRTMGKLGTGIIRDGPLLKGDAAADAARVLALPDTPAISTNDYHVHRRPGEVMVVRWLAGAEQVDPFYQRLQAHFDAAFDAHKEDERQANGWRQDAAATAYRDALDAVTVDMPARYLRPQVKAGRATVMWTMTLDEMSIAFLCDGIMGVSPAEVVGRRDAPPTDRQPTDADLTWYFKLFALRGPGPGKDDERMCFFTYLQKSSGDDDW